MTLLLMLCVTTFLLVNVLGASAVSFPSLFQKKCFLSAYSGQDLCWVLGDRAVNKTHTVAALLGGAGKAKSQLSHNVIGGVTRVRL